MTRVPGTLKDKGHLARKTTAYSILVLLFPIYLIVTLAERLSDPLDNVAHRLHKWMRPCVYKDS